MGVWNNITKFGFKNWNGLKGMVSDLYNPLRKNISSIHRGAHWIDDKLMQASKYGIPHSLIDLVRGNPIYSEILSGVDLANDVVNYDIPAIGSQIQNLVEGKIAPRMYQISPQNMVSGMTPNRGPSARQVIGEGMAVG